MLVSNLLDNLLDNNNGILPRDKIVSENYSNKFYTFLPGLFFSAH